MPFERQDHSFAWLSLKAQGIIETMSDTDMRIGWAQGLNSCWAWTQIHTLSAFGNLQTTHKLGRDWPAE